MFGVPLPYAALGGLLLAVLGYFTGHHYGWVERDNDMKLAIAAKNEESRQLEQKLAEQVNQGVIRLQEANNAIDQKQSDLDRAIRAGRVRLPAASCVPSSPSATASVGSRDEEVSESDRQTLAAIAAIAAEGDRAINQLNACIDAYNQVRDQINGQR